MTVTTTQTGARWHMLLQPRWLLWHALVWLGSAGMFFLGDWQLRRAEAGNSLSWAYTFEWPLFAVFTVYFWVKSLRDEMRRDVTAAASPAEAAGHDDAAQDGGWDAARPNGAPGRLTPADGEAYTAWLTAEVQHRGRLARWLR